MSPIPVVTRTARLDTEAGGVNFAERVKPMRRRQVNCRLRSRQEPCKFRVGLTAHTIHRQSNASGIRAADVLELCHLSGRDVESPPFFNNPSLKEMPMSDQDNKTSMRGIRSTMSTGAPAVSDR